MVSILLGASLAAGALAAAYGLQIEPRRLSLERVTVPIADLPAELAGFTIGLLSDLHLGPMVPVGHVRRAAEALARHKPDLVVIAGDLVSTPAAVPLLEESLDPVRGALAVPGNWDRGGSSRSFRRPRPLHETLARQSTVRLLVNEGVEVRPGLWFAGLDDAIFGRPDLDKALAGAPEGGVRILLAHEPDVADRVRLEHRIALQLSGHSHGGQVRLPLWGPVVLPRLGRKYHSGLNRAPACAVYTTRGLGMVHLPVRFLCPPEITLITLVRNASGRN